MAEKAWCELPAPLRPFYAQNHASNYGRVIICDYQPQKSQIAFYFIFSFPRADGKNGKKRRTAGETRVPLHLDCFMLKNPHLCIPKILMSFDFYYNSLPEAFGCLFHFPKGLSQIQNSGWRKKPEHRFHFFIGSLKMVLPGLIHNSMRKKWRKTLPQLCVLDDWNGS